MPISRKCTIAYYNPISRCSDILRHHSSYKTESLYCFRLTYTCNIQPCSECVIAVPKASPATTFCLGFFSLKLTPY